MLESYELSGKANTTEFKKLNGYLVNKADNNGLGFAKKGKELDYRPNNYNETSPQILQNFEPLTENGKKYKGYKYSIAPLKQTQEVVMCFKKDLTFTQGYTIVVLETIKEILLCLIQNRKDQGIGMSVSSVEKDFTFRQAERYLKSGNHIVQINADFLGEINVNNVEKNFIVFLPELVNFVLKPAIMKVCEDLEEQTIHNGRVADLSEVMDTLLLETQKNKQNSFLNIELLWLIILVESLNAPKMSTILTEYEMITELKTLNFYHTELTKHFTQLNRQQNELSRKSSANFVANIFLNEMNKLQATKRNFCCKEHWYSYFRGEKPIN